MVEIEQLLTLIANSADRDQTARICRLIGEVSKAKTIVAGRLKVD